MNRKLLAIISVSLLIAGCGSTKIVTVQATSSQTASVSSAARTGTTARRRSANEVVATAGPSVRLPVSRHQSQCIVSQGSTQIVIYSQTLSVDAACQAQIKVGGWRTGGEFAAKASSEVLVCYVRNAASTVVASVFDTRTSTVGPRTCFSLIATRYWFDAQPHLTTCTTANGAVLEEPPGTRCSSI